MRIFCILAISIILAVTNLGAGETPIRTSVMRELLRATSLEDQGKFAEAERILLNTVRDAEGLELALTLNNLGALYTTWDRVGDAAIQFKRALDALAPLEGEVIDQLTIKIKLGLALNLVRTGRISEAIKLDLPGIIATAPTPQARFRAKSTLGSLLLSRNQFAEADVQFSEALAYWTSVPPDGRRTGAEIAALLNNLGVVRLRQNRREEAREFLERSYATWQTILGPDSPILLKCMGNIGDVYASLKLYDEAASWLSRSYAGSRRSFGEFHPMTIAAELAYADVLKKSGHKKESAELRNAALEARHSMVSASHSDYIVDYRDLKTGRR